MNEPSASVIVKTIEGKTTLNKTSKRYELRVGEVFIGSYATLKLARIAFKEHIKKRNTNREFIEL